MKNTELHQNRKNLWLISQAKFLSGFAGYIYDIGIVIYLFQKTESVAVVGDSLLPSFCLPLLFWLSEELLINIIKKFS